MGIPLRRAGLGAVAAAAIGLAITPQADAVIIGAPDLTKDSGAATCVSDTCSVMNGKVKRARLRAPSSGTVTRWKVAVATPHDAFNNDGPARLQILKRTDDQPGVADDVWKVVREGPDTALTPGEVNVFDANLRIGEDQAIALATTSDTELLMGSQGKAVYQRWNEEALPPQTPLAPDDSFPGSYWLFNARIGD